MPEVGPRPGSTNDAIEWTVTLASEANVGTRVGDTVRARARSTARDARRAAWKGWRVRVAPPGHRQNLADLGTDRSEIHVDVDSVGENLEENRALPGDTRAAPPGTVHAAPSGRVWSATVKLDRPICSCTASPQRRRGVTVPSLIETIRELWMTRTNREAWCSLSVSSLVCAQSEHA